MHCAAHNTQHAREQAVEVRQGAHVDNVNIESVKRGGTGSEYLLRRLAWPACGRWCLRRVLATLDGLYAHWPTMRAFGGYWPVLAGVA